MGRLIEYQQRYREVDGLTVLGPVVLVEVMPAQACIHGIRWVGRLPCPRCGLLCQQWWCDSASCGPVVDPDHVCVDPTDWVTIVYRDGRTERRPR